MPFSAANMALMKSTYQPTDSSVMGGAATGTPVGYSVPGDWMPVLAALQSGVVDTNAVFQIQEAYLVNTHGTVNWGQASIFMANSLSIPGSNGTVSVIATGADAANIYKMGYWHVVPSGTAVAYQEVNIPSGAQAFGLATVNRVFRGVLLLQSDGSVVANGPANPIQVLVNNVEIGWFQPGFPYVTSEFEFAAYGTLGDVATQANNQTAPGGLVWVRPRLSSAPLYSQNAAPVSAILAPGQKNAIFCRETLQPTMPIARIKRALNTYGIGIP